MRSSACYPRDFGRFVASQHIKVMDSWRSKNIVGEVPHFVVFTCLWVGSLFPQLGLGRSIIVILILGTMCVTKHARTHECCNVLAWVNKSIRTSNM